MATPSIAIAKAALAAALIRPDPTSIAREHINEWHELLEAALEQGSPTNIQQCKQWLFTHAVSSSAKVAAIGKYLVALSSSLQASSKREVPSADQSRSSTPRRKQLRILYLVNDILHHAKHHRQDDHLELLTDRLRKPILEVLTHTAAYDRVAYPRHHQKLTILAKLWQKQAYFDASFNRDMNKAVSDPSALVLEPITPVPVPGAGRKQPMEAPFEMPSTHGDPDAPYYDLPAANMMPHIVPNSKTPIDPRQMKALHFNPGPADPQLVSVVKGFLKDADLIYGIPVEEDQELSFQLDDLGQTMFVDKLTGDVIGGESYYGWSKKFCERMKSKTAESKERSRSGSGARSISPRKRRRSMSISRSRSRSRSNERSPARYSSRNRARSQSRQRDRYRSRSRSRSLPRPRRHASRSPSPRRERVESNEGPPRQFPPPPNQHGQIYQPQPPFPFPFPGGIPLGPDGLPIPPPRPPNYTGPWPPPPPPAGSPPMAFPGFIPPVHNAGQFSGQNRPPNQSTMFHQSQGNR